MKKLLLFLLVSFAFSFSNLNAAVLIDGDGDIEPQPPASCTVTTGVIADLNYCPGETISVPWTESGGGCVSPKTVYLSNSSGSFASSVAIGSGSGTPITCMIPLTTPAGTGYRVKVSSSGIENVSNIEIYARPTVTASPSSASICAGNTTELTGAGAITYTWLPATGLNSVTGAVVSSTPSSGGTINYSVTGTDGNGCTNTAVAAVVAAPGLTVNAGSDQNLCENHPAHLTATGADEYTWSPATHLDASTGASVTANLPAGVGSYTYTVTGSSGTCPVAMDEIVVNVTTGVTVNAGEDVSFCGGSSVVLTATGGADYTWSPTEGLNVATGASVTANPTSTINYSVTSTSGICSSTDEVTVTFLGNSPSLFSSPDVVICNGDETTLSIGYSSEDNTYSWTPVLAGSTETQGSLVVLTISPTASTEFIVTGTAANSCSSTDTVDITVNPLPVILAEDNITICEGESATVTVGYAADDDEYSWNTSVYSGELYDDETYTVLSVSATDGSSGIPLIITAENSFGCISTKSVNITTNPAPVISTSGNVTVLVNEATNLTASGASSYSWTPSTNLNWNVGSTVTFTSSSPGTFNIYVTGTDANGCSSTNLIKVTVKNNTGINSNKAPNPMSVYPNPYKGYTNIAFSTLTSSSVQLDVFNMLGQKVVTLANTKLPAGDYKYSFSAKDIGQASGVYFVKLILNDDTHTVRIVEIE